MFASFVVVGAACFQADDDPVGEHGDAETSGDGDPSTGDGDPSTGDGDPSTGDGDPSTGDGDPTTGDGDPTTGDGDPTTGDGDPPSSCGWIDDPSFAGYYCGGVGTDPTGTYPYACPRGLVEGEPCGSVAGVGCCDANGDNWYCATGDGTDFLFKEEC